MVFVAAQLYSSLQNQLTNLIMLVWCGMVWYFLTVYDCQLWCDLVQQNLRNNQKQFIKLCSPNIRTFTRERSYDEEVHFFETGASDRGIIMEVVNEFISTLCVMINAAD